MEELFALLVNSNPKIAFFFMIVGYLRITVKPIMTLIHIVVKKTKTEKDDQILHKVTSSSWYAKLAFVLDLLTSIKIKK